MVTSLVSDIRSSLVKEGSVLERAFISNSFEVSISMAGRFAEFMLKAFAKALESKENRLSRLKLAGCFSSLKAVPVKTLMELSANCALTTSLFLLLSINAFVSFEE